MINRGEIVREAIINSGIKIETVATKLGVHRSTLSRNYFRDANLEIDIVMQIEKICGVDLSGKIPELKRVDRNFLAEPNEEYKIKYMQLQEKHIKLLEEHKQLEEAYNRRLGLKKKPSTSSHSQ